MASVKFNTFSTLLRVIPGFDVLDLIGQGAYANVYKIRNVINGNLYALKVEHHDDTRHEFMLETRVLACLSGCRFFPSYEIIKFTSQSSAIKMQMLGPHLGKCFYHCMKKLSLKTVLIIADQLISRLQYLHSIHYVHRDIKPENILVGSKDDLSTLYLVDYGLCHQYRDPKTLEHAPLRKVKALIGNFRYGSINSHMHFEASRRDDMESLGYLLVYLMKGELPWQGIQTDDRVMKENLVGNKKIQISVDNLCRGLPSEFAKYLSEVKSLKFDEEPDYAGYRERFRTLFINEGYVYDMDFEWNQYVRSKFIVPVPELHDRNSSRPLPSIGKSIIPSRSQRSIFSTESKPLPLPVNIRLKTNQVLTNRSRPRSKVISKLAMSTK